MYIIVCCAYELVCLGADVHRYAEVRLPGVLHFFKDASSAAAVKLSTKTTDNFYAPLDLRLVVNFITPIKKGDNVQLDLELTDNTIKLRQAMIVS